MREKLGRIYFYLLSIKKTKLNCIPVVVTTKTDTDDRKINERKMFTKSYEGEHLGNVPRTKKK